QKVYAYYLNNRSSEPWAGTIAAPFATISTKSINHLDNLPAAEYLFVKHGGWHFTNMGGAARIIEKIESYGHQEFNNENIKAGIITNIARNTDFIGRKFRFWIDETDLPNYLTTNKNNYQSLFK